MTVPTGIPIVRGELGPFVFKIFTPTLIASRSTDGRLRIEGIGSSTIRDHHGDQFTLKALRKMADSSVGMTVFMNHEYRVPQDVFGKIEKAMIVRSGKTDERTKEEIYDLRLGIIVAGANDQAVTNFNLIEADEIKLGISIGAMIPDGGAILDKTAGGRLIIDDVDPVEYSMVGIPASPRAFTDYAMKAIVGVYPNSDRWDASHKSLLDQYAETEGVVDVETLLKDVELPVSIEMKGLELKPGEVGELTVHEDGTSEAKVVKGKPVDIEALTDDFDEDHYTAPWVDDELAKTLAGLSLEQFVKGDGLVPDLLKAEWSQAYKDALPASAFACPKQRAYPHHDKGGAVDPSHLRAALSRIGDSSNVQCPGAKAHLAAHAAKLGIGQKSLTKQLDSADAAPLQKQGVEGEHQHPHAHVHGHEHTHGYGDSETVHDHEHAHVHSHSHDSGHEHRDEYDDYSHNHPHNGSYDDSDHAHSEDAMKSVAPTLVKTKVTVWETDEGKVLEVDTGRSKPKADENQSVQESLAPETTGGSDGADGASLAAIQAMLAKADTPMAGLLKALTGQLQIAKADNARLIVERETLVGIVQRTMQGTAEIIRRVGELPAGRKTVEYGAIRLDFSDLGDIYSEDVRKLMRKES